MKARLVILFVILIIAGFVVASNYSYFFAKKVVGEISEVKQLEQASLLVTGANIPTSQLRSLAVAVKHGSTGEIYTASTEDRQWIVAKTGQCAIALFYPYPPWNLEKAGTYHNARLISLCDNCEVPKCKAELEASTSH